MTEDEQLQKERTRAIVDAIEGIMGADLPIDTRALEYGWLTGKYDDPLILHLGVVCEAWARRKRFADHLDT